MVVTGATGPAGHAVVSRLIQAGARVIGSGTNAGRLEALSESLGAGSAQFRGSVVDLRDEAATRMWAEETRTAYGHVDGVIHLVGGWRAHPSFAAISMLDAEWLHDQLVRTLQHVTLAFHDDLVTSAHGRFATVSATAVDHPAAGGAAYASAKAAAESWTRALADSFAHVAGETSPDGPAAVIFVVQMLVDDAMRAESPGSSFAGATDVDDLADAVVDLWATEAAFLNGSRLSLAP
jgi:NADP-dependent 3-hydroxy acid dehydrogenase YdfG